MDHMVDSLLCRLHLATLGEHLLEDARVLPCCQRSACAACIRKALTPPPDVAQAIQSAAYVDANPPPTREKQPLPAPPLNLMRLACPYCAKISRIELVDHHDGALPSVQLIPDVDAERKIQKGIEDISDYFVKKLESTINTTEARFDEKQTYLDKRKKLMENEIHAQAETLKSHVDRLAADLCRRLSASSAQVGKNLERLQRDYEADLDEMRECSENIRDMSVNYSSTDAKLLLIMQQQNVNKVVRHVRKLKEFGKQLDEMIGELRFQAPTQLPDTELLGRLKEVRERNTQDAFKTQIKQQSTITRINLTNELGSAGQAFTPRYLTLQDPFHLLVTDSQSKSLLQLSLDGCNLVRSTTLGGALRAPDGVAVNRLTGDVYVTDVELKVVFKLDAQFNVLRKLGGPSMFKWPRGLFYDTDAALDRTKNTAESLLVPDRLYVCDPSNQRVVIFNDKDQHHYTLTVAGEDFLPLNAHATRSRVYVADDWAAGNCVRVFDKRSHEPLQSIVHMDAYNPLALFVDEGLVFVVGRLYYESGATYLFCFASNTGELQYKTCLNVGSECLADVLVDKYTERYAQRLVCVGEKKLHVIKF